jgi:hypothetical protein
VQQAVVCKARDLAVASDERFGFGGVFKGLREVADSCIHTADRISRRQDPRRWHGVGAVDVVAAECDPPSGDGDEVYDDVAVPRGNGVVNGV